MHGRRKSRRGLLMREFAATTKVPIGTTRQQIESLLRLNKAARVVTMDEPDQILVGFILASRAIRYCVPLIKGTTEQRRRTKWRALALVIKAKFESVASGIETLEEAFLSQTVM